MPFYDIQYMLPFYDIQYNALSTPFYDILLVLTRGEEDEAEEEDRAEGDICRRSDALPHAHARVPFTHKPHSLPWAGHPRARTQRRTFTLSHHFASTPHTSRYLPSVWHTHGRGYLNSFNGEFGLHST